MVFLYSKIKKDFNKKFDSSKKNKCCEWCNKLAGEYNYKDTIGTDVYKRHTNCNCLVEFIPGNGKKQNVHTKKWSRIKEKNNIANFETVDAKRLPNAKERSKIIREAIKAPLPIYAEELRKVYKLIKPKEGYMDVFLHGTQYYTEYEHAYKLDTETLSLIISGRKDYKPEKNDIRLLSCSTGKVDRYGNCVAQKLANLLGVNVYAPIDVLYVKHNGVLNVGESFMSEEEGFKIFEPKKVKK